MTKYMKITRTNSEELYIDLYKINRIQESHHSVSMNIPCHWDVVDQALEKYFNDMGCFSTRFSVPGERDMEVFGTAKEFISHIEEQQKRARKGKEVQPYEPIASTVYKKNGSVHPIDNLLEPTDATNRCRRELNNQASDYIQKSLMSEHAGMIITAITQSITGEKTLITKLWLICGVMQHAKPMRGVCQLKTIN